MDIQRVEFAKASIQKSKAFTEDPLIEFVILWIGLNALYNDGEGREDEKFERYMLENNDLIKDVISKEQKTFVSLVEFVGNSYQHTRLNEFIRSRKAFLKPDSKDSAEHFRQLIYKIRNNMFHSEKPWNQEDEATLLKMVNPVIEQLLSMMVVKYSA